MVYKKYIYKKGKKFGPYYFKSVRKKDGTVKTIYLGKKKPSPRINLTLFFSIIIGLLVLLTFVSFTTFNVMNTTESEDLVVLDEQEDTQELIEPLEEDFEINISEETEILINESIEEENISSENETDIFENITIETTINESSFNETILENISFEGDTNETLTDVIPENESLNITEIDLNETLTFDTYHKVIANQPVLWEKKIILGKEVKSFKIKLPKEAKIDKVYKVKDNLEAEISFEVDGGVDEITANVVSGFQKKENPIWSFFKELFRFTGFAVFDDTELFIEEPVEEIKVQYYLPGPTTTETLLENGKQVVLESEYNYTNVSVSTTLNDVSGGVSVIDSSGDKIPVNMSDTNGDGNIDYLEWQSNSANEIFNISIVILNFQSFPVVGREWIVMFNTTGAADLRITTVNGTTWGEDTTENDLAFRSLSCGNSSFDYYWENDTVVVEDYSCDETGYETSYVRTSGGHYLEFDFGGLKAYARNAAACGDSINSDTTLTGDIICDSNSHGLLLASGANNFVLDCAGFMIDGNNKADNYHGIYPLTNDNVTIKNCEITDFDNGILTAFPITNFLIYNNTIHDHDERGIMLYDPLDDNVSIVDNRIYNIDNDDGIYLRYGQRFNISTNQIYDVADYGIHFLDSANATIEYTTINHTVTAAASGVRVYNVNEASFNYNNISNCADFGFRVQQGSSYNTYEGNRLFSNADHAIYLSAAASYSNITNNYVYDNSAYGIIFAGTDVINNTILNNTISGSTEAIAVGAWATFAGPNNKIINNTIHDNSLRGIFLVAENTTIYNNIIYNNERGIYVYIGSSGSNVTLNEVYNNTVSGLYAYSNYGGYFGYNWLHNNTQQGIYLNDVNESTVEYNNVSGNWDSASYNGGGVILDSNNNILNSNRFTSSGHMGLRVNGVHFNNIWVANVIANNSIQANTYEFIFGDSSPYVNFQNNTLIDTIIEPGYNGLDIGYAINNTFIDLHVIGDADQYDMLISDNGNHTDFLNSTWNSSKVLHQYGHNITRRWYLDVHVNDSSSDLENANVSVFDTNDAWHFSNLTDITGWIARQNLTEYTSDGTNSAYLTNYTLNTSLTGYNDDIRDINLTESKKVYITLSTPAYAPVMESVRISPESPYTQNDLLGYCNATDQNGDNVTFYYEWYLNGVFNQSGQYLEKSVIADDTEDSFTYDGGIINPAPIVDEDWNTNGYVALIAGNVYVNYTIPGDVVSTKLQIKYAADSGCTGTNYLYCYDGFGWATQRSWTPGQSATSNISLDSDCISGDKLQIKVVLDCGVSKTYSRLYEEMAIWSTESVGYAESGVETLVHNLSNTYTTKNQNWTFNCSANDGALNSSWMNDTVTILNSPPNQVTLSSPANGAHISDRSPTFEWLAASDNDTGDSLTYRFVLDIDDSFDPTEVNVSEIAGTSYSPGYSFDVDTLYYWKVRAYDGEEYGEFSNLWNFTIDSAVDISLDNDLVDFSSLDPGDVENTTAPAFTGFTILNNGNVMTNISVNASSLFSAVGLDERFYQFKADNLSDEPGSFNWSGSLTDWTNMSSTRQTVINYLNYTDTNDSAEINILVRVPGYEPTGNKYSNVTFWGVISE